jgi:hypothetical protein
LGDKFRHAVNAQGPTAISIRRKHIVNLVQTLAIGFSRQKN